MDEGSMRCDVNVSVALAGEPPPRPRFQDLCGLEMSCGHGETLFSNVGPDGAALALRRAVEVKNLNSLKAASNDSTDLKFR